MTEAINYRPVLRAYAADCQPQAVAFLDSAGGFSGARLWRLTTPRGPLCLRRWPQSHPTKDHLEFIQAVLWHVHQEGFDLAPLPLETLTHAGYVRHEGHLWELTPWLAGAPDYRAAPNAARRRAAMTALGEFHLAAQSFPLADDVACQSPGIGQRQEQLAALLDGGFERLRQAVAAASDMHRETAARIVEFFPRVAPRIKAVLAQAARVEVLLVPCLRDVWCDNVLFVGDGVSGLIDFGALQPENISADVARLFGSMAEDDRSAWKEGLVAYESVRRLSELETMLVAAFDESGVLLGAVNWLTWLYLDARTFDQPARVQERLDYFCRRLGHLADTG